MNDYNSNTIKNVLLITPTSSQPRFHKRASQIATICNIIIFSFERKYYNENVFPDNVSYTSLGEISDGQYIFRIISIVKAVIKIRSFLKKNREYWFYAMSFDCLMIAKLSGIKNGFYEIGDLRQVEGFAKIISFIEPFFMKNVFGIVATSKQFYEHYLIKCLSPVNRLYVIENKINVIFKNQRPNKTLFKSKRIKIGLIGLLRFKRPIDLLLNFVKDRPNLYEIECFGDGPLKSYIESYQCENIHYHGSFNNYNLPAIYKQIDVNYVVYDAFHLNVRLAIPNKIYESAYFGVPILCCEETALGRMVSEWKIGKTIRINDKFSYENDVGSINAEWINKCITNCFKLSDAELLDDGEKVISEMFTNAINRVNSISD